MHSLPRTVNHRALPRGVATSAPETGSVSEQRILTAKLQNYALLPPEEAKLNGFRRHSPLAEECSFCPLVDISIPTSQSLPLPEKPICWTTVPGRHAEAHSMDLRTAYFRYKRIVPPLTQCSGRCLDRYRTGLSTSQIRDSTT